jgi:hypothetical protein
MPKANNTEPVAMLPIAQRFRVQSFGPHRMARDISASSEKNLFNMAGGQIWAKKRGPGAMQLCSSGTGRCRAI